MPANAGAYTLTGQPAALKFGRVLRPLSGAYVLTGQPAALVRGPIIRGRARDRSGLWVLVVDGSGHARRIADRGGLAVLMVDHSEGTT
jgi:hypothetical protein